ncbi:hypothetical protein EDC94DRAFT_606740, partial [Helicostylum pulchrum]
MAIRFHRKLFSNITASNSKDDSTIRLNSKNKDVFKAGDSSVFSGTDNGIVNLSATAPFTTERYKFHLNLYNQYEVLKDSDDIKLEQADEQYLTFPN